MDGQYYQHVFVRHMPYISLLIIPCIIYHVTNKETLNLERQRTTPVIKENFKNVFHNQAIDFIIHLKQLLIG